MTWPTPPRDWEQVTGNWTVDADRDEATVRSGGASLLMKNTAVATKFRSAWIAVESLIYYEVWALVYTDNITAGYNLTIDVEEYLADKSTLFTTTNVVTAVPNNASAWEWIGGRYIPNGTTRWVRLVISKTTNAHNVYWDKVHFEKSRPAFSLWYNGVTAVPNNTWTKIPFNLNKWGGSGGTFTRTNGPGVGVDLGVMKLPIGGQYAFQAAVEFDNPPNATLYDIRIKHIHATTDYYYGNFPINAVSVFNNNRRLVASVLNVQCYGEFTGEQFEVEVFQNSGGPLNTVASTATNLVTYFTGHRLNPV